MTTDAPLLARMKADIDAGIALCRDTCEYFSVCGGGEPVNKLFENGSFATAETTYCRMTKMRVTDLVLDRLEQMPDIIESREATLPSGSASPVGKTVGHELVAEEGIHFGERE